MPSLRSFLPPVLAVLTILLPLLASLIASRLLTPEDAARDYCIHALAFKESNVKYLGSTQTGTWLGNTAQVEFKVAGTEPVDTWIITLKQPAWFLPWRAESYAQRNYETP
jgi:hypothetical protein